ncbi:hypothetical protein PM082_003735 [Marasmius tenuissimus]|nr:hypothetical protein PM082_003735 [Marasmius tenuissimus]
MICFLKVLDIEQEGAEIRGEGEVGLVLSSCALFDYITLNERRFIEFLFICFGIIFRTVTAGSALPNVQAGTIDLCFDTVTPFPPKGPYFTGDRDGVFSLSMVLADSSDPCLSLFSQIIASALCHL